MSDKAVAQLANSHESLHQEFKRVSGKMVAKAIETVCAFANTEGGILILGVADEKEHRGLKRIFGCEENMEAVDERRRKVTTELDPPVDGLRFRRLECLLRNGPKANTQGHLLGLQVPKSEGVHSVRNGGTYVRLEAGNRHLVAREITELSYRRGTRSATSEAIDISLERLQTNAWQRFLQGRGALTGSFADQLGRIGLAYETGGVTRPTRAAVLLFADEPGSLLAGFDTRADVRLMVYDGKAVAAGATPNLRRTPTTIRGPLVDQVDATVRAVMHELAQGLTLTDSGFRTSHVYPERVVREAIVNALVHRDYRLNRDVLIRILTTESRLKAPALCQGRSLLPTSPRWGPGLEIPSWQATSESFLWPPILTLAKA